MKKLVVLLIVGLSAWANQSAVAQELLVPGVDTGDAFELDLPPMPEPAAEGSGTRGESVTTPQSVILDGDQFQPSFEDSSDDYSQFCACDTAILESTGTWLRRGFWHTEIDAVLLNRVTNKDSVVLISQLTASPNPFFGVDQNRLEIGGTRPGVEGVPRVKLGRFLFRDHKNRDHNAEFIVYGGGQWSQGARLDENPLTNGAPGLFVPQQLTGGNVAFNGATSSQYEYDSRFNSFEINYHVKQRMRNDRMELEPSGHWVRRAGPSVSRTLLAGIRYFDMTENLDWDATGIPDFDGDTATEIGNYLVRADNDMIGTHAGFSWNYETARWSLGASAKGGVFLNIVDVQSAFFVTGGLTSGGAVQSEDTLSFIGESSVIGKWHLRPNLSLRVGLEVLYVTSVALAQNQINFIPSGTSALSSSGDPAYLGGLIGFEGYW